MARFSRVLNQLTEFSTELFFVSVRLLVRIIMNEVKAVFTDKHLLDNRDDLFSVTNSWELSDQSDCDARIKIDAFSIQSFFKGVRLSIDIFMEEIRPIVIWRYGMQNWRKWIKKMSFWSYPDFIAKNQLTKHWIESYLSRVKFSIGTFLEQISSIIKEKIEIE